jgi:ribonuclease BN (tRNA processing enzyme)
MPVQIVPITHAQFQIGNLPITLRVQTHPGGSIGVRLADLVFMTDTIADDKAIDFMRGARLLLHEVWLGEDDIKGNEHELLGHSAATAVARVAMAANVQRVMPIHLHPKRSAEQIKDLTETMKCEGLQVTLPVEGRMYEIPPL